MQVISIELMTRSAAMLNPIPPHNTPSLDPRHPLAAPRHGLLVIVLVVVLALSGWASAQIVSLLLVLVPTLTVGVTAARREEAG